MHYFDFDSTRFFEEGAFGVNAKESDDESEHSTPLPTLVQIPKCYSFVTAELLRRSKGFACLKEC
jgi:hypothetical protein